MDDTSPKSAMSDLSLQQLADAYEAHFPQKEVASESPDQPMSPKEAKQAFDADPVGFIETVVHQSADKHLDLFKEQAELLSALQFARLSNPDFKQFEPFILKEIAYLIETDEDGILDPWDSLLERGFAQFKERFTQLIKQQAQLKQEQASAIMEKPGQRSPVKAKPKFSRKQIANMSLGEFLANESAIDQAMQQQRIQ